MEGFVIWLTGLSGAGKSTIASALKGELLRRGCKVEILDGDEVRKVFSKGLGYSKEDRDENIRRIGYVASLLQRNGVACITAAISPYREVRDELKAKIANFFEIYVKCSFDVLVQRDTKGLYQKALTGEISNFTGVNDPYEEPLSPALVLETDKMSLEDCVNKILLMLEQRGLIKPEPRLIVDLDSGELEGKAASLPQVYIDTRGLSDLYMLATGSFAPIYEFMGPEDYQSVVESGCLSTGAPFTLPVVLRVDKHATDGIVGDQIALRWNNELVGVMHVSEVYELDPRQEAEFVYGTDDTAHEGVEILLNMPKYALAGPIVAAKVPSIFNNSNTLTPLEVRQLAREKGWKTMVGFQTRNPIHRAHEYLQKVVLETVDGLLLHPIIGETKKGDLPADIRIKCYTALLENYYPKERVIFSLNPAWMRYAGPREAVMHAIVRRNYGCTHFIVGRDHAGVGGFYDPHAAHRIFDDERFSPSRIGIEIIKFDNAFYCRKCQSMASDRTCPHSAEDRESLSGTLMRELLRSRAAAPENLTRPEVWQILTYAQR